jgi:CRP/FNR family cyclic AMP-dependent transcriptional regulator
MMLVDGIGYVAASLVLATFCMRRMVALRLVAIASNVAFIGYGSLAGIDPVLLLHVLLLPMNALRLAQAARQSAGSDRLLESRACPPSNNPAFHPEPMPKPRSVSSRAWSPSSSGRACTPAPTTRCTSFRKS